MSAGVRAFREAFLTADIQPGQDDDWSDFAARQLRYAIYWSFFENTAYRNIHRWAQALRAEYGLYAHTRNIYNPAYRLSEFWVAHLLGGALDPSGEANGAIPIALGAGVKSRQGKQLRQAIAQLWRDSNWQVQKSIWTRYGAVMGDVGLMVVDDVVRQKVYLRAVHPGSVKCVEKDPFGYVKGYTLEEQRADPRGRDAKTKVTYTETALRDGADVVYRTTLNNVPYAWNGVAAEWREPYGFVPFVLTQHLNVGMDWGWAEMHAGLAKVRELDDIASKLDDQIRKSVDAPWLFAGVAMSRKTQPTTDRVGVSGQVLAPSINRETGREEMPILYSDDPQARAQPLIAPLDIPGVLQQIGGVVKELERDYPELTLDVIASLSGDSSGRALRIAREPVENKVIERRAGYDADLVRAQQMAIAIGGLRGYPGYAGFGLDSYAAGALDHTVAPRPVFPIDPLDTIAEQGQFYTVAGQAETAGIPIEVFLKRAGWSQDAIDEVLAAKAQRQAQARAIFSTGSLPPGGTDPAADPAANPPGGPTP